MSKIESNALEKGIVQTMEFVRTHTEFGLYKQSRQNRCSQLNRVELCCMQIQVGIHSCICLHVNVTAAAAVARVRS